ncbi:hypothetical protein Q4S45_17985 [Massilia sp. R2A-15]|uniref:hypothetical protein n=1 Tax=Massilia sp. R2A-15 TaxID=3064278 RepID=UPI002734C573|nr:hypothetical protein [Massilia sp. R2A-15]WLI88593.1 hypothetical protein Q4S45_17985 [Massilia sp. R2A-15]
MTTLLHGTEEKRQLDPITKEPVYADSVEGRRARRMDALKLIAGIWKDRTDIPADGVEYQRQLREE